MNGNAAGKASPSRSRNSRPLPGAKRPLADSSSERPAKQTRCANSGEKGERSQVKQVGGLNLPRSGSVAGDSEVPQNGPARKGEPSTTAAKDTELDLPRGWLLFYTKGVSVTQLSAKVQNTSITNAKMRRYLVKQYLLLRAKEPNPFSGLEGRCKGHVLCCMCNCCPPVLCVTCPGVQ